MTADGRTTSLTDLQHQADRDLRGRDLNNWTFPSGITVRDPGNLRRRLHPYKGVRASGWPSGHDRHSVSTRVGPRCIAAVMRPGGGSRSRYGRASATARNRSAGTKCAIL